jgi:hypothetical protein
MILLIMSLLQSPGRSNRNPIPIQGGSTWRLEAFAV